MGLAYFVGITALFRAMEIRSRAAVMTRIFSCSVPLFVAAHLLFLPYLDSVPSSLNTTQRWVSLGFGLLLYCAIFLGGILQLYNLADRGFSVRILIDIDESSTKSLALDEILAGYSQGKGIEWMYRKRIDGLVAHRLVEVRGDIVVLLRKGYRLAALFAWLRSFLQLGN